MNLNGCIKMEAPVKNGKDAFSKATRLITLIAIDALLVFACLIIGTWMAVTTKGSAYAFPLFDSGKMAFSYWQIGINILLFICCFAAFRMYRDIWSRSGVGDNFYILAAIAVGTAINLLINLWFGGMNKFNLLFQGMVLIPVMFVDRYANRILKKIALNRAVSNHSGKYPILVVGAGFYGNYILAQIQNGMDNGDRYIAAFVDDDLAKLGTRIGGVQVKGTTQDIPELVDRLNIREIIIAQTADNTDPKQAELISRCKSTNVRVRILSPMAEADSRQPESIRKNDLRDIRVEDVLFRPSVQMNEGKVAEYIRYKTVLVTGGGGSIGSEICRQVATFYPEKLIIFDIYENTAYELLCEFKKEKPWLNASVEIGSVRDRDRLDAVMEKYHPDLVLHCAAHKHVPLMEANPCEAVKNNVLGTKNVLESADSHGVERFVMLSTDKAINPTNVMGASKRITELMVQHFSASHQMKCMTVRFGNVLGSHGSVIPLFESQIQSGGPVLVTDPEITRYFMSIKEAAQLVLQAGSFGESGALYILEMGEPIRILDLAEKLIRYHGFVPNQDIDIQFIGLRPGEKMYEELMDEEEKAHAEHTEHERILQIRNCRIIPEDFEENINGLIADAMTNADDRVLQDLHRMVPGYKDAENVVVSGKGNE